MPPSLGVKRRWVATAGCARIFGITARIFVQITPPTVFQPIPETLSWGASHISQDLDQGLNTDHGVVVADVDVGVLGIDTNASHTRLLGESMIDRLCMKVMM